MIIRINYFCTCNAQIKMEKFTKFLGVIIDQNLNWKQQILHVKKKVSRGLGIIRKARKYLNYDALRTLYHSFVYPYLDYCIEVFGSAKSSVIEPLCRGDTLRVQGEAIGFKTATWQSEKTFMAEREDIHGRALTVLTAIENELLI